MPGLAHSLRKGRCSWSPRRNFSLSETLQRGQEWVVPSSVHCAPPPCLCHAPMAFQVTPPFWPADAKAVFRNSHFVQREVRDIPAVTCEKSVISERVFRLLCTRRSQYPPKTTKTLGSALGCIAVGPPNQCFLVPTKVVALYGKGGWGDGEGAHCHADCSYLPLTETLPKPFSTHSLPSLFRNPWRAAFSTCFHFF